MEGGRPTRRRKGGKRMGWKKEKKKEKEKERKKEKEKERKKRKEKGKKRSSSTLLLSPLPPIPTPPLEIQ